MHASHKKKNHISALFSLHASLRSAKQFYAFCSPLPVTKFELSVQALTTISKRGVTRFEECGQPPTPKLSPILFEQFPVGGGWQRLPPAWWRAISIMTSQRGRLMRPPGYFTITKGFKKED